jgi:hypothetical protein
MKGSPHVLIAAVLAAIALFATSSALLGGGGGYPMPTRDLRVIGSATRTDVVPGERAFAPLVAELSTPPLSNPFSKRPQATTQMAKYPPPPPPRLELPPLPVLPEPVK